MLPRGHAAGHAGDIREAGALEQAGGDAGAIATAADCDDRSVAGQVGRGVLEVAEHDVTGAGDMA